MSFALYNLAMFTLRYAAPTDIGQITEIYGHHVIHGSGSFEEVPPNAAEMLHRFETITGAHFPYLVAVEDGEILGYAYANLYRARSAYRFSVENSVYIRDGRGGRGVGAALLNAVIEACTAQGARLMIAVIGDSANAASIALHTRCGFNHAGVLPAVGFKHGRWLDSVFMTRSLGPGNAAHATPPAEIVRTHHDRV